MASWSGYGTFDTTPELKLCCRQGHRPSLVLQTGAGGHVCLLCFSNLISDSTALFVHRTYAIDELLTALEDHFFSNELVTHHHLLLVNPLSEAIASSSDDSFSRSIMEAILTLCEIAKSNGKSLVEDFIVNISRHIHSPSQWNRSQCHTLHLMGLLMERHCEENHRLPDALRNQRNFIPNLIYGLRNTGDEFQGEVLYVLYKIASLENGLEELLRYCPNLCEGAVHALLKTDKDESRMNCIALLSVLAERLVFDIKFHGETEDEGRRTRDSTPMCLTRTFAEAIKGSLLSSDAQVQASALRLITLMCTEKSRIQDELQILVEEGIVEYVLEILRLSDRQEIVQSLALDVLSLLSSEKYTFLQDLTCGLETMICVLENAVDTPFDKLQMNALELIRRGIPDRPGILSTARAEQLLSILLKLLGQHIIIIEGHPSAGVDRAVPRTFHSTCSTLIALLNAPCCPNIANVSHKLQAAATSAMKSAVTRVKIDADLSSLRSSCCLFLAVWEFSQKHESEIGFGEQESLVQLCEVYLFPTFVENMDKVEDEGLVVLIFHTLHFVLERNNSDIVSHFAKRLALQHCFALSFEILARFRSRALREGVHRFMSSLTRRLIGGCMEPKITEAFLHLPDDPAQLLAILEQKSVGQEELISAQHAIIILLSISSSYDDRLASEIDTMASLEHHLLVNRDCTLAENAASSEILNAFLALYVSGKEFVEHYGVPWSSEAELILELVIRQSNNRNLLGRGTSKAVLRWFLQRESLRDVSMMQLLNWFTTVENTHYKLLAGDIDSPYESFGATDYSYHFLCLAELVGEEMCATDVLLSLFHRLVDQGLDDGVQVVVRTTTNLVRLVPSMGNQLLSYRFETSVLPLISLHSATASEETRRFGVELLFQIIYNSDLALDVLVETSWLQVARECASLISAKMSSTDNEDMVTVISFLNLILFKSTEENVLMEAAEVVASNGDLCARLESPIMNALSQGTRLSTMDMESIEAQVVCAAMIFHLLRLKRSIKLSSTSHEPQYIGFKSTGWSNSGNSIKAFMTSIACEDLCRILYFSPGTLKVLASSCVAVIFSQLADKSHTEVGPETVMVLEMPSNFFPCVTMALQGPVLGDLDLVSQNASYCLYWLLQSRALTSERKMAVSISPWNRVLVEHLALSLSTSLDDSKTCTRRPLHAAYIALGILKVNPALAWLPSIFTQNVLTRMVANFTEGEINTTIICICHELLLLKLLSRELIIKLRDLFQAVKNNLREARSFLFDVGTTGVPHNHGRTPDISDVLLQMETKNLLQTAMLELVVATTMTLSKAPCIELDCTNISEHTDCVACNAMIDKFMQESYRVVY